MLPARRRCVPSDRNRYTDLTEEVLAEPLPRLTPYSITDPARLRTAVEQTQVSGLACEEQETAPGSSCIASPVFAGPTAVAALSVAVPRARFRPAQWHLPCARQPSDCHEYCVPARASDSPDQA